MRTFVSMLVLLSVCAVLNAQVVSHADTNFIDENGLRQGYWRITAGMKNDNRYSPETVFEEGNYFNDKRAGVWQSYFPSGKLKSRITYKDDRAFGWTETFYENGNYIEQGNWMGNRWTGPYARYYENGMKQQNFTYSAVGKREGQQLYYFESGILMIDVFMKNGKEDGIKREYNCRGQLARESYYYNGILDVSRTVQYSTLNCSEYISVPDTSGKIFPLPPPPPPPAHCGSYGVLYKDKQIYKRGSFNRDCELIDGEERIYNDHGILVQIKLYRDGKYVGDAPLPADDK